MVVVQQFSGLPSALLAVKDKAVCVSSERGRKAPNTVAVTQLGNCYDSSHAVRWILRTANTSLVLPSVRASVRRE
jgi:hypothetical protein